MPPDLRCRLWSRLCNVPARRRGITALDGRAGTVLSYADWQRVGGSAGSLFKLHFAEDMQRAVSSGGDPVVGALHACGYQMGLMMMVMMMMMMMMHSCIVAQRLFPAEPWPSH